LQQVPPLQFLFYNCTPYNNLPILLQIQKLKRFVDFVSNLEYSSYIDTQNAKEIILLIEGINNPANNKNWNVCIDIYDNDVQYRIKSEGVFGRKWAVYYENDKLSIIAETNHTSNVLGHFGDDFYFDALIYFYKDCDHKRIYLDGNIDDFVNDAENYSQYITDGLNDIKVDIDISEFPSVIKKEDN